MSTLHRLSKLIISVICLPIIAVASVIRIATIAVINCGAYLLGPVMSFLLFGIVYTVCMQQWNQAAVFVILEVACGFLLYATAAIAATSHGVFCRLYFVMFTHLGAISMGKTAIQAVIMPPGSLFFSRNIFRSTFG